MKNLMVMLALVMMVGFGQVWAEDAKVPAVAGTVSAAAVVPTTASSPVPAIVVAPVSMDKQVEEITEPPQWMKTAIAFALKMPYVGPVLVQVLQWMGVLAALLTALSGLLLAFIKISDKLGKSIVMFATLKQWLDKAYPYVAWLSMLNVKMPEKQKEESKV